MNGYERLIGKLLDNRYKIIRIVGIGGMAVVYEADDVQMNRKVAVKMLKDEIKEDEREVRRFINESKVLAKLSHPNIVRIYDVSFKPDNNSRGAVTTVNKSENHYIVMEFIDGITLKDYINGNRKLNWREAIRFTEQILDALSQAHENEVIHRDMKPQNVILLRNGSLKITDFGIAKIIGSEQLTMNDKTIGTVHYISPEQVDPKFSNVSCLSDIYSVGIMLYEMVTGTLPFIDNAPLKVALMQVNTNPRNPKDVNSEIPKGLSQIIMKAMMKHPDDRYKNAREMIHHLQIISGNAAATFDELEVRRSGSAIVRSETPASKMPSVSDIGYTTGVGNSVVSNNGSSVNSTAMDISDINSSGDSDDFDVQTKRRNEKKRSGNVIKRRQGKSMLPIISGVTLALLIVLGVSAFNIIVSLMNTFQDETKEDIDIPDYIGKIYDENSFTADIEKNKIKVTQVKRVYNDDFETNEIIDQSPSPGSKKRLVNGLNYIEIELTVSLGKMSYEVEDLTIMEANKVQLILTGHQLKVERVYEESATVPSTFVIRTEPSVGTVLKSGDSITIYVSSGQDIKMVFMPDVVGMSERDARKVLADEEIVINEIKSEYNDKYSPGIIFEQDIEHLKSVPAKSTKVTLKVSMGKRPENTT
ncbi:putative serine/threonine-protein kinase [Clostridia bacterium]|nr:putative serine/threonine-protein kinase [Clostridia bacterium]